jgi:pyruvate/2-oxoacid:ferredoxin oxidoreductase beta subunit
MKTKKQKNTKAAKPSKVRNVEFGTEIRPTWCPGCFNFQILAGVKMALAEEIKHGK